MTKRHREEPAIRPLRLTGNRLAVPGVIGVRDPDSLGYRALVHVLLGPDAGFPESQRLVEWRHDLALAEVRSLPKAVRKEAGIELPEEERARLEAQEREMAGLGLSSNPFDPWTDSNALAALALEERARLTPLDERARQVLTAHGHTWWLAGYSRNSAMLWAHRMGGPAPRRAAVLRWDMAEESGDTAPPPWMSSELHGRLWETRWFDRMFRALSDGAVTEPALLFADRKWDVDNVVEDDITHAAIEVAARMSAGADEVFLPLHGPARRVRLPAFTTRSWEEHPREVRPPGFDPPEHPVHVPAEDVWVLMKDVR